MNYIKYVYIVICVILLHSLYGCSEDILPGPSREGEKPNPITSYEVTAISGGAIITYDLPMHRDLRYVKAVYTLSDGRVRESKSSIYKNEIVVDGFAEAGEFDIALYAVGVGDVLSDPINLKVPVLTPPYRMAIEKLQEEGNIIPTYGGIRLFFENVTEAPIAIHIIARNDEGQWERARDFYTRLAGGFINARGYPAQEREFGVYITDRWNNISDTLTGVYLPVHEEMMDKSLFREYNLAGDTWQRHSNFFTPYVLWDGADRVSSTIFHTAPGTGIPQHFTFDMGVRAELSRFLMYSRLNHEYRFNHPKIFELWGSNDPNPDGTWESWTFVGRFESIKPSGLPLGQQSTDDIEHARAGEEFEIEFQEEPYQYWRFRTLDTWGGNSDVSLGELTFFGTAYE